MNKAFITIEASANYGTNAPTLEVLVNGAVYSSAVVTATTGVGVNLLSFTIEYPADEPSALAFRFNDGFAEGGRDISIESLRVNGYATDLSDLTSILLAQNETATFNVASNDFLFGRTAPTISDLGTADITGTAGDDEIRGIGEDDIINALAGNDTVKGNNGDDGILGGAGDDTIFGGNGNDLISGDGDDDRIWGGDGNDLLYGGSGNDNITGGDGNDVGSGGSGTDLLVGDSGDDILFGGDDGDIIIGDADDDVLRGDAGNDIILGGAGDDDIDGGADNDQIVGGAGNDTIEGGTGADEIEGNNGADTITGGAGNDKISGGDGADTISGGDNDDVIWGGDGGDTIDGDAGADSIHGGAGADTINGGAGNDIIHGHSLDKATMSSILNGDATLHYSEETGSLYRLVDDGGNDTWVTELAEARSATVSGVAGHLATVTSQAEYDFIDSDVYGANNAWLSGTDTANEGVWSWFEGAEAGLEFYDEGTSSALNNSYINWTTGQPNDSDGTQDYIYILNTSDQWADAVDQGGSGFVDIEAYIIEWEGGLFSEDNAVDTIDGGTGDDQIYGWGGADVLSGGADDDQLFGGAGDDTINGDAGDDILFGNDGDDVLNGGADDDVIYGGDQIEIKVNANTLQSYGGAQDAGGTINYMDDDVGVELDGNLWKKFEVNYTVTSNTVIAFDFRSTNEAEISGIGFDNDDTIDSNATFKVYGDQNWGRTNYDNYDGSGDWTHYEIDVGSFYTGTFSHLIIVNDDDGGGDDGEGYFRNITIHEGISEDNEINGGDGLDELYGDSGADTFIFDNVNDEDIVHGFTEDQGDILDLSDIITFSSGSITDYIQLTNSGDHVILSVDANGATGGASFTDIAELRGNADLDVAALYANSQILVG
jgi:Ca2+-binding RTX toxin-like protein